VRGNAHQLFPFSFGHRGSVRPTFQAKKRYGIPAVYSENNTKVATETKLMWVSLKGKERKDVVPLTGLKNKNVMVVFTK
jgi:hypothetical protein